MSVDEYTIIADQDRFVITKDQLLSDPGNYFATYFLGDFEEAKSGAKELILHKEPLIIRLIQAHLRGYDVIPIPDSIVPSYMTKDGATQNLLKDAQYFGLTMLEDKIIAHLESQEVDPLPKATRSYKLATYRSGWVIVDITEKGFETLLERFSTHKFQVIAPGRLDCPPGFKIVTCWRDYTANAVERLTFPEESHCVLLESVEEMSAS